MSIDDHDAIRERAYLIWERESRPHGRDKIHWEMAIRELAAEMAPATPVAEMAAMAAKPKKKTAPVALGAVRKGPAKVR